MGYGTAIKQQFYVGRAKGEADRQKIKLAFIKLWRAILNGDAIGAGFVMLLLTVIMLMFSFLYILAMAINEKVLVVVPDAILSPTTILTFDNLGYGIMTASIVSVIFFLLATYQTYQRICIKNIIKKYKIAVIK